MKLYRSAGLLLIGFILLFALYHSAEYFVLFHYQPVYFFSFQIAFFLAAWLLGNKYSGNGLAAWGLPAPRKYFPDILKGLALGTALYAFAWLLNILAGWEQISRVPSASVFVRAGLPFAVGVFFSSVSEDVLTRGLVFAYARDRWPWQLTALVSALVFLGNHIYRLQEGPITWTYLFLLGILLVLPLLRTGRLWFTSALHWSGNLFFFLSQQVISTESTPGAFPANLVFSGCILLFIPLAWLLSRSARGKPAQSGYQH